MLGRGRHTTAFEVPELLIQYECERCKRGYVPPRLDGADATSGESRRRRLAQADDDAYQLFAQTMRFCPECCRFVCLECWSPARDACRVCASGGSGSLFEFVGPAASAGLFGPAQALAPANVLVPGRTLVYADLGIARALLPRPPRRPGLLRRGARWAAFAAVMALPIVGAGLLLASMSSGSSAAQVVAGETARPTRAPALATATPTVPPLEVPVIECTATPNNGDLPYTVTCTVTYGSYGAGDSMHWYMDGHDYGGTQSWAEIGDTDIHEVRLQVYRTGTASVQSNTASGSAGFWP